VLGGAFLAAVLALWSVVGVVNAQVRAQTRAQFSLLTASPTSEDEPAQGMPIEQLGEGGGLTPDSVRYAGTAAGVDFYLAVDGLENICLASYEPETEVSGSSCVAPGRLGGNALALGVWNYVTGGFEAYYVPDEFTGAALPRGQKWTASNLIVIDADSGAPDSFTLVGDDGAVLEITRLESGVR
jgi:hypothetical protein